MARGAGRGDGVELPEGNQAMTLQVVRPAVVAQVVVLIMAAALVIGAVACEQTVETGPPATTIPPTQPATTPAPDTPAPEGTVSLGTPDDAASLSPEETPVLGGSLSAPPTITPPALLPGTAEPTVPALQPAVTAESEEPSPTDTPVPQPPAEAKPTDTPTPVPPPEPPAPPTGNRVGQSAPDFTVETIDGDAQSLTDFKQANQSVVLYFFSST